MVIENERCRIEITVDTTYAVDSADNRYYDVVLNPCQYGRSDVSKTFSIHIDLAYKELRLALIGPFYSYNSDCAVLDDETLTVLQDNSITQVRITDGSILQHKMFECFGCNFAIYRVAKGYVIYGEMEITMLDFSFEKMWSFSGKDIFVSVSDKQPFRISGDTICLYDFDGNYYELDLDGNRIR
ncbi:MAG: hypothetical protein IJA20_05940 [Methanocorpusculum sp.]|nr:hypothetical protein [Oscillospiraceae bacterium]MBQ3570200.1 hypothetical protein [Methanocorpusculum sp.]